MSEKGGSMGTSDTGAAEDLARIRRSAARLGVELDEEEALQWLTAVAARGARDELTVDVESGVFGHRIPMLDFTAGELARFRALGDLVRLGDRPGVETALALSGSAAQSRVQTYPGDCDYFERVHIAAPSRSEACALLAAMMREKALSARAGPTYQLTEVRFGSHPADLVVGGVTARAGSPVSWSARTIEAGRIEGRRPDGRPAVLAWEAVADDPGWCKLDWIVVDPLRGELAGASNMLDVTWEAPDGSITPLDGYLDGYFQEVYLDAASIPIFSKLVRHMSPDALDDYVADLEAEVRRYVADRPPNYGKAAKRLYNIFRLSGRYAEAAYLRELFDEPAALLYQVWSVMKAIDEAADPASAIRVSDVRKQTEALILAATEVLDGEREQEVVRRLLRLFDALSGQRTNEAVAPALDAARAEVLRVVNQFFHERLTGLPTIRDFLEGLAVQP
jgi:hypothetical protein